MDSAMKNINWEELTLEGFKKDLVSILEATGAYWVARPQTDEEWLHHYFLQREFYELRREFEAGSAAPAVTAFLTACDNGYDPPGWVQRWLYDALFEFDASMGKKDLLKLLNLSGKQRTGNGYTARLTLQRDEEVFAELLRIKTLTDYGVKRCAEVFLHRDKLQLTAVGVTYGRHKTAYSIPLGISGLCAIYEAQKHLLDNPDSWACHWVDDAKHAAAGIFKEYAPAMRKAAADTNCDFSLDDFMRVYLRVLSGGPLATPT